MLNRKQVNELTEIVNHFNEVEHFTLEQEDSNGIGPVIKVHFALFNNNKTTVDLTDVSSW